VSGADVSVAPVDERTRVGVSGERAAETFYVARGYRVIARNWRCRIGELDLVLSRGQLVVVCEVKCRSGLGFGHPLEAITWAKLRTLRQLAAEWVREHHVGPAHVRIDAIGVVLLPGQEPRLTHARGVG